MADRGAEVKADSGVALELVQCLWLHTSYSFLMALINLALGILALSQACALM